MKKILLLAVATLALTFNSFATNDPYVLNDNNFEQMYAQAEEMTVADLNTTFSDSYGMSSNMDYTAQLSGKNPWASFALCWVLGGLGIHRHYMGTAGWMWAAYLFTFGGIFGIVPFVDWIVLLIGAIENDISSYVGNTKFFMWL